MGIIENAKEVVDLVKKAGDIELYRRIVELEGEIIELTRTLHGKEDRISELERSLRMAAELTFKAPFYFAPGDKTPFCANCWETRHLPVHAVFKGHFYSGYGYECPNCKAEVHLDAPV